MQDLYSFRQEEKHEDTMFIIYQEEKPQFATLSWLIGAGAGIRIGYLHYVKVMLATAISNGPTCPCMLLKVCAP